MNKDEIIEFMERFRDYCRNNPHCYQENIVECPLFDKSIGCVLWNGEEDMFPNEWKFPWDEEKENEC